MDKTRIIHTAFRSPSGCYMLADHMGMTRDEVEAVLLRHREVVVLAAVVRAAAMVAFMGLAFVLAAVVGAGVL